MVKFCVFYYGKPEDPAAFDAYYWNRHLPPVTGWPGIRRIAVCKGHPGGDLYLCSSEPNTARSSR